METATLKISASDVNKLRQQTGLGMMDCKKALTEAGGDFEKAVEILRKKGQKIAVNRGDRQAKEGFVLGLVSDDKKNGVIVSLNCETDFVAKNGEFTTLAQNITRVAIKELPATDSDLKKLKTGQDTVEEAITNLMGKIGEKMEVSRYEKISAGSVYAYNHPGNKIVSLIGFNREASGKMDEAGKEIAMQVAAMNPIALDRSDVDAKILEKEIEIGKEQARSEGKPEAMLEKIAQGKLNKFYRDYTLLNQSYVRDEKKSVKQYLDETEKGLTVTAFKRVSLKD
ncbi:MAG: elongation factor Ts [Bacteroidetes bacterium]|nr:elongation factor Ts [Bacteroidota bacterium]